MATRMYITVDNAFTPDPTFTPAIQGTWDSDFQATYRMVASGEVSSDAAYLTRTVNTSASAATIVHALVYSRPLSAAFSIIATDDVIVNWRCSEAGLTQNCFQQFYWGVMSNDGTVRRCLSVLDKGATEYSTSLVSRTRTDAASGITYTTVPGDRLFVEIGWDKDGAVSGNISHQYGYSTSAGDLLGDGDTGVQNPWIEWVPNFTFDVEGTSYGSTPQRMMTGCGS